MQHCHVSFAAADNMLWLHEAGICAEPYSTAPELIDAWSRSYYNNVPKVQYDAIAADSWSIGAMLYAVATSTTLDKLVPRHVQGIPGDRAAHSSIASLIHQLRLNHTRCKV